MRQKNQKGFTLIELLVVVLIIGILASVALPQYERAVEKSRVTEAISLSSAIWKGQQAYFMANGTYATDLSQLDLDIPGTDANVSGTPSKLTKDFSCRAVNAGGTAENAWALAVCRRNGKPYAIYYDRNNPQLGCHPDNEEGRYWCRIFTGKEEEPYLF